MTNKKFYILLGLCITFFVFCIICLNTMHHYNSKVKIEHTNIKTDVKVIKNNFPCINGIEKCYWTVDIIGSDRSVGPQSYKFKAFVVLNNKEAEKIKENYNFDYIISDYEENLLPLNLNSGLNLLYSEDLSNDILGTLWIGKVSFDYNKRLLYLETINT